MPQHALVVAAVVLATSCAGPASCQTSEGVADYFGSQGSFDTPEAAFTVALESLETSRADYGRAGVDEDIVRYRYVGAEIGPHTWEIWRQPEGWQVLSVSGCLDVIR